MFGRNSVQVILLVALLSGCDPTQPLITGEPLVYGVKPFSGEIVDRDVSIKTTDNAVGIVPHKGEMISIVVNNVFLKYVKEIGNPHILVYTVVYDDGNDDPGTAFTKVLFNERDQPPGVNLGLADRIIYGPTPYKGLPIRIKFFIVELDKEDKELASQIISAAGSAAQAAQPQAAPAIAIGVQIAETLNALNKDDFELRFDLTLHPVDQIGTASSVDENLREQGEPSQRHSQKITLLSSLRTGSYLIIKRELRERFLGKEEALASYVDWDHAQEGFITPYLGADGKLYSAREVRRYQGGYLYQVTAGIADDEGKKKNFAKVRPRAGPNKGVDFGLATGIRQRYIDQTYTVLTILSGLPAGIDNAQMRAASQRDAAQLASLLDDPANAGNVADIGQKVEALASAVQSRLEQQRASRLISSRVAKQPGLRTQTSYPALWTGQIDPLTGLDPNLPERDRSQAYRNAIARNTGLLVTLNDLILNLPLMRPDEPQDMAWLRGLDEDSFTTEGVVAGYFELKGEAIEQRTTP
ncbi:MAG: hypothetical protein QNJ67_22450 [Kiloniellales bacterium]|nr:hypothetical protein [Kiloniellales bacterium]